MLFARPIPVIAGTGVWPAHAPLVGRTIHGDGGYPSGMQSRAHFFKMFLQVEKRRRTFFGFDARYARPARKNQHRTAVGLRRHLQQSRHHHGLAFVGSCEIRRDHFPGPGQCRTKHGPDKKQQMKNGVQWFHVRWCWCGLSFRAQNGKSSHHLIVMDSKLMPQPTSPSLLYDHPGLPDANPTAVPDAMPFKTS